MKKAKVKWFPLALAAVSIALWCAAVNSAQGQAQALRSVAVRWPGEGVSPAQLEGQLEILREDGARDVPEMTLWTETLGQKLKSDHDAEISCAVTQIYGHGEDVISSAILQGNFPVRGDAGYCVLSDQAAFSLFGSAKAMGQNLEWNNRNYIVQGIFKSADALMLVQSSAGSETRMPNMQLRFAQNGSRQQAEEFLARTSFGSGAQLLDMPLIAWGLQTLAALPVLLLGLWIFARFIAWIWKRRKYPRLLPAALPLLPLAGAAVYFSISQFELPAALIPSGWSDFTFWEALPKSWDDSLTQWLRNPAGGDIDLIFAVLNICVLVLLAMIAGVWALSRVKIQKPAHVVFSCGGCIAWIFIMVLYFNGLRVSPAMWLLPCLWIMAEYWLYVCGDRTKMDSGLFGRRRKKGAKASEETKRAAEEADPGKGKAAVE